jgi:hypothetical protein
MNLRTTIVALAVCIFIIGNVSAQSDTTVNQSLSLVIGTSLPMSEYAATTATGGYAKTGLAIHSNYIYLFNKNFGACANYTFFLNKVNSDAVAKNYKSTIEGQINRSVDYSAATANNWNGHSAMIGLTYNKEFSTCKKLCLNASVLAGTCYAYSPASESTVLINRVYYSAVVKRSGNFCLSYQANVGLAYQTGPKTSLNFNACYTGMNLKGYNLDVTDLGNNAYINDTYQFSQKISMLSFAVGIATHFN